MEVEHAPHEKIRTCSIHVKVTGKEKRVTNCAAICGKSPILPVVNSAVKAKEITDNTNRDLIMRNISKRKETKKLTPDALVLFGGSDLMGTKGHVGRIVR